MALTKTLTEIKEVLPRLASQLSNPSLLPNFERAEYKYLVPIVSPTLYASLSAKYNATPTPTTNSDENFLLKKMRLVAVAYAFLDELGLGNITITDTGARRIAQGGTDRPYGWEYQELKDTLKNAALDGTDVLLSYMLNTKSLWPAWTDSDAYKKYVSILLKSGSEFSDYYTLYQPSRTWWTMRNVISNVQELHVEDAIGKELFVYLRDAAAPTDNEKESIRLLKNAVAFLSVNQACRHYSVSFTDNGFTILGQKNMSSVDSGASGSVEMELLKMKMEECDRNGRDFLAKARNQLVGYYNDGTNDFKTAFDKSPLKSYVQPEDRTSGNETRKIFVL